MAVEIERGTRVDRTKLIAMYRTMRLIRRFEEQIVELVNRNEVPGVTHEYIGQEAVAAGVCHALLPDDVITSTHRGHGHILAKGGDPGRMTAELMGKVTGCNRGRGGSMHIADLSLGIYGANGIVGAGVPIACGAAFASKLAGTGRVAVAFFGDGGINQGVVHEALNLAAIWKLPVIFVCENNKYAATTPLSETTAVARLSDRASAYGMSGESVDGMDVEAVYDATARAAARARAGDGPTLLECLTYRFVGHFTAEKARGFKYRTEGEIESWRLRDPLVIFPARLKSQGICNPSEIDADVEAQMVEAIAFARRSALPNPEDALDGMYAVRYPGLPARGW